MHLCRPLVLCLACLLTLSAAPLRAQAPAASLISNGDFEAAGEGDAPHWFAANSPGRALVTEDGNRFLRLQVVEPGQTLMAHRMVRVQPDHAAYELSYRVRYHDLKRGDKPWFDGRIMMNFKDVRGATVGNAPTPYFAGTRDEWTARTYRFAVPDGAVSLEVMPALFRPKSGRIDFDDLRLVALSPADTQALLDAERAAAAEKDRRARLIAEDLARPGRSVELKTHGNRVVGAAGAEVLLQGLSVDSMQWGPGERVSWSIRVALDEWKANVIRLPVDDRRWFGEEKASAAYRKQVDDAVALCAARGAYLILDYHGFGAPRPRHVDFWKDAAARYANHPAVLFELFNEPHGISWKLWRDGGDLRTDRHKDENPAENQLQSEGDFTQGMQALVDAVRGTGAKNIVLVGGLDWAYDLTGVVDGYALDDRGGNGIVYVSHIYPWKTGWAKKVRAAAADTGGPVGIEVDGGERVPRPAQQRGAPLRPIGANLQAGR